MKAFLYGFVSLVLLGAIAAAAGAYWVGQQLDTAGPLRNETVITVKQGTSVSSISKTLEKQNVISNHILFQIATRLKDADTKLRAGEYAVPPRTSINGVIDIMVSGKMHQYKITIQEGLNSYQIVDILNKNEVLTGEIENVPHAGTLFPETYHFTRGTSRATLIERMRDKMRATLNAEWEKREENPYIKNKDQALTLASIIEKETNKNSERQKVAGVFINRLKRGMKLQTDPTTIYALTDGGKNPLGRPLYIKDLKTPHPYNTYHIEGLPPGPIAHPGQESIVAALHPEKHNYLYFVADGTGGHKFARSLKEHNRNVAAWRKYKRSLKKKK